MKYYALFANAQNGARTGIVSEVFPEIFTFEGVDYPLDQRYTAELISWLVECPDWVVSGATYDGTTWVNPPTVEPQPEGN